MARMQYSLSKTICSLPSHSIDLLGPGLPGPGRLESIRYFTLETDVSAILERKHDLCDCDLEL